MKKYVIWKFGFQIAWFLDDLGWNKAKLTEAMGVVQVRNYVKREENFKLETLCKLEKVLGIELVTVLKADEEIVEKSDLAMGGEPGLRVYDEGRDKDLFA